MNLVTAACDNVVASRLGTITREATRKFQPDSVDQGLILLQLLKEAGFIVLYDQPEDMVRFFSGSHREIKRSDIY